MLASWPCEIATTVLYIRISGQLTDASGQSVWLHIYHVRRPVSPFASNVFV